MCSGRYAAAQSALFAGVSWDSSCTVEICQERDELIGSSLAILLNSSVCFCSCSCFFLFFPFLFFTLVFFLCFLLVFVCLVVLNQIPVPSVFIRVSGLKHTHPHPKQALCGSMFLDGGRSDRSVWSYTRPLHVQQHDVCARWHEKAGALFIVLEYQSMACASAVFYVSIVTSS